jgi:UDP-N-acetylmuramoylalanine-D-glutamate ligase
MRILICGGRDFNDWGLFRFAVNEIMILHGHPSVTIISGHARGADSMGERWATVMGYDTEIYPAKWSLYGRLAGHQRNLQMLNEGKPDLVVAFPGGRGTADMVRHAQLAGVTVINAMDLLQNSLKDFVERY